ARRLLDRVLRVVAQQAGDHEALARAEFHGRLGTTDRQRRDREVVERDRTLARKLRDFWADADRDPAVRQHSRGIRQADAEILVLDRRRAEALAQRDRELAPGKELCRFTRERG